MDYMPTALVVADAMQSTEHRYVAARSILRNDEFYAAELLRCRPDRKKILKANLKITFFFLFCQAC